MLRDPYAAEDATQDVFSRAFANIATYRGDASPRTWLMRIAKNRCVDEIRRRQVQPWRIAEDGELDQTPATDAADVAQCLTDRETVDDALAALEGNERALVVLRFRHGMSFAELASAFGLREGTARMRITRALKRMRLAVEEPITERMPPVHQVHDVATGAVVPPPPAVAPAAPAPPPGPPAMGAPPAPAPPPGPPGMGPPPAPPPPAQRAGRADSATGFGFAGPDPALHERLALADPHVSEALRLRLLHMSQAVE